MLQDYKLGLRMLLKYPGLTMAGGLALAIAIAIGAGWYDFVGKVLLPTIPLPEGDRIVLIDTRNVLTNGVELRVGRDFLEWRRELRTIEDLGAFRLSRRSENSNVTKVGRNLIVGTGAPERIQLAELTAAAFRVARVSPLLGRALVESDEVPGAPSVVVLGYEVWQRSLGARQDVIGSQVKLGETPATVVGVMPEGFGYPFNYDAWTPLPLQASYGPLEGGAISVIGRLAPGVTRAQADAEVRALGERTAAALPATHEHLRPRVQPLGEPGDDDGEFNVSAIAQLALTNLPSLLVLVIACMSVGTLVYARTATREGEIALRSALGASRARIVSQLFVETLALASLATAVGLVTADQVLTWGIEGAYADEGGAPFWITPGLSLTTILYAGGLAIVSAAMLSILPALRVTQARVQTHLANLGNAGATLRFGRLWTGVMIAQVALTAIGIPVAMEGVSLEARLDAIRARFPSGEYLAARIDVDPRFGEEETSAFEERRARTFAEVERRVAQEPGVVAVTFADRVPGGGRARYRIADIESSPGAGPEFDYGFSTSAVGPGFFEAFDRPIVAGRAFHGGDQGPAARTVIVNEAFVRGFRLRGGSGSAVGARLRYSNGSTNAPTEAAADASADRWFEIVGVVRDFGLDLSDEGDLGQLPYVFHLASAGTVSPLVMSVRVRGNPAPLVARLPVMTTAVDAGLSVDARPLDQWRDRQGINVNLVLGAMNVLALFLSALGIFSLLSVSVSRRTREIGLRAALGANPRHVLIEILSRAMVLMGTGTAFGGAFLLFVIAIREEDVALYAGWLGITCVVMLTVGVIACIEPARRALKINPIDALRQV
jgi:predicted permease